MPTGSLADQSRVAAVSKVPAASNIPQDTYSTDPRSLLALSQALTSFLSQVNGSATTPDAGAEYRQVAAAYGEVSEPEQAPRDVPDTARTVAIAPPTGSSVDDDLVGLKDDFETLFYSLQSASRPGAKPSPQTAGSSEADASLQLKSDVTDFVTDLLKITDRIGKTARIDAATSAAPPPAPATIPVAAPPAAPAAIAPTVPLSPIPVAAAPAATPQAIPAPPNERSSLFAQIGERFRRHLDEL